MPYTYNYSQPAEYRFSLDSIELAKFVAENFRQSHDIRVLDLCAGCGVVGFEFHFYRPETQQIDFVEVQETYNSHFAKNLEMKRDSATQFQWHLLNYKELLVENWKSQFDLIICNPPYFEPDQGKLSPSQFKNRCRFYLDSDFRTLIKAMTYVLKPGGEAYFLMRPLSEHKKNLMETLSQSITGETKVDLMGTIRGTFLIRLKTGVY